MSFRAVLNGREREITILARRPHLVIAVDGKAIVVQDPGSGEDGRDTLIVDGQDMSVARAQTLSGLMVRCDGRTLAADLHLAGDEDSATDDANEIRAPMPGAVVTLDVNEGDALGNGDTVLTIESMKLQMALTAPRAGVVAKLLVAVDEVFEKDQVLVRFDVEDGADA